MWHPTARNIRRDARPTRRESRRPRREPAWTSGLGAEPLEARAVPTIVFSPQSFGTETAVDGGGTKLPNVTYEFIFWGTYWGTSAGNAEAWRDFGLAKGLGQTAYFSGLGQYVGGTPTVSVGTGPYENLSASAPTGGIADATLQSEVSNLVAGSISSGEVPQPRAFGNSTPIYVVVTPPGSIDNLSASEGGGQAYGWNLNVPGVIYPQYGNDRAELGNASAIWLSDFSAADDFTVTLGHESAELMTDPFQDSTGISITSPPSQICDNEAENLAYRLDGTLVQSYWSQANGAFIVPDGNSFNFDVSSGNGSTSQFTEGSGQTLGIVGGQDGIYTNDSVTLNETNGAVTATYDGQAVQFDPGAISSVVVDEPLFGSLDVTITGSWSSSWGQAPITIVGSPLSSTTIDVAPASGGLARVPTGLVSFQDLSGRASIYVNDQAETGSHSWTLSGGSVGLDGRPLIATTVGPAPSFLSLTTGSGVNDVDVESAPCTTVVNDTANEAGTLSLAQDGKSLAAIRDFVDLIGGASAAYLYDQVDASNETVTFDGDSITQGNMYPFYDAGVGSVTYYAGSGTDTFEVTPTSKALDSLSANLTLVGGPASSLVVNDSGHAAPTTPSGAYAREDSYTLAGSSIARTSEVWYGFSPTTTTRTIDYSSMYDGVTFDADDYGTPIGIEGTAPATPTSVQLGTAGTSVSVADQGDSLQPLGGTVSIVGGSGSNSLAVDDQSDPGAANPTGPASYLLAPGTLTRTDDFQVYITTLGWVDAWATRTIDYANFASVTLDSDNQGTPVDVEGISAPTTVNVGSGNTAVTVAKSARSLAPFTSFSYATLPLTLDGGTGSDSLTVDDQQESAYSGATSVTVSAGSIVRWDRILSTPYPREAIINYRGFAAGVTLNADDNGTPVDLESTSAPTTIDLGTGNTAVTVGATAGSLAQLAADLTVVGNSGLDSLTVNDSLDPNAATSTRVGLRVYSTSYSYAVTGSDIARTTTSTGLVFSTTSRNVNYSSMLGGVTLDTDDHGAPVDVESTSATTTIDVGTGNTAVSVTPGDESLTNIVGTLTVNGGPGTDSLSVNDSQTDLPPTSTRIGLRLYTTSYYYTVAGSSIARTRLSTGLLTSRSSDTVDYANIKGGVTFDTDAVGTPVDVSGPAGTVPVAIVGGSGINTLVGPALANTWALAGSNSGTLDGWVDFSGFANLDGGGVSDSFDFTNGATVGGSINGEGGNALLNYARYNFTVIVDLATGSATGVVGSVVGVQGAVGGTGSNVLVGNGRGLLIGGTGPSQLSGGSGDTLMIAGSTTYDIQDSALLAILDEWDRTDLNFNQRVADLEYGTGLNGPDVLTLATVKSNDLANAITSNGPGQSWIFARTSDAIVGRKSTDLVVTLPT